MVHDCYIINLTKWLWWNF